MSLSQILLESLMRKIEHQHLHTWIFKVAEDHPCLEESTLVTLIFEDAITIKEVDFLPLQRFFSILLIPTNDSQALCLQPLSNRKLTLCILATFFIYRKIILSESIIKIFWWFYKKGNVKLNKSIYLFIKSTDSKWRLNTQSFPQSVRYQKITKLKSCKCPLPPVWIWKWA